MSSPSPINTADPLALRYLMTEAIFAVGETENSAAVETMPAVPVAEAAAKPAPTPQFSFYGKNNRQYLFLTQEKQYEWMSEQAMDAFVKTLAALKLAEDDVALFNLASLPESPSVEALTLFFKPKVVVNLGASFTWPEQDGINIFHTHAFSEMLVDAEKKRVFWTTVKRLLI